MSQSNEQIPRTMRQWLLEKGKLRLVEDVEVPQVGDYEVLVNIKAVSLNYRDISLVQGTYPFPAKDPVVPTSDGSGIIAAVGPKVSRFALGDAVMPGFHPTFIAGNAVSNADMAHSLGAPADGVLREYLVLPESALTRVPQGYSHVQAATLPCAALTAWDAFYGLEGRTLRPGQWVLTQGSGGVSVFAIQSAMLQDYVAAHVSLTPQLAKAAGAKIVATTSSSAKAARLRELGADVVINYRETPAWGAAAREATGGRGFDHVIEVGGPGTLAQSVKAVARQGVISVIGFIAPGEGKGGDMPTMLDALSAGCIVRGIFVGNRLQMEALVDAIDARGIEPVVDKVFKFEQAQEAYDYMEAQKHFGKVVIEV